MLVKGVWETFEDGVTRPLVNAHFQTGDGSWQEVAFLLDSGADRTVLEARLLPALASLILPATQTPQLGGVGGLVECKFAQTRLAFTRDDGQRIVVKGPFSIFAAVESSDISVLGRDVTNNFDVIYSFSKREVLLLARPHDYLTQLPY